MKIDVNFEQKNDTWEADEIYDLIRFFPGSGINIQFTTLDGRARLITAVLPPEEELDKVENDKELSEEIMTKKNAVVWSQADNAWRSIRPESISRVSAEIEMPDVVNPAGDNSDIGF